MTPITNPPNQPLDRTNFVLTFSDEFTGTLDLDASGNSSHKWYEHPPFNATVGAGDVSLSNAYNENGYLVLKASNASPTVDMSQWRYGLLSSMFWNNVGFAQQYGYFEARMKFPSGSGTWPQFWLFGQGLNFSTNPKRVTAEIDILEAYGGFPGVIHQNYHEWTPNGSGGWTENTSPPETTFQVTDPEAFHIYGVLVQPDFTTWYIDDRSIRTMVTPAAAKEPLSVMIDYAIMNSGAPGYAPSAEINPSYTYVDYVRVYSVPAPSAAADLVVEQPTGIALASGGSRNVVVALETNTSLDFTIRKQGSANLTGLTISKDGTAAGDFVTTAAPQAPVAAGGSTSFPLSIHSAIQRRSHRGSASRQ